MKRYSTRIALSLFVVGLPSIAAAQAPNSIIGSSPTAAPGAWPGGADKVLAPAPAPVSVSGKVTASVNLTDDVDLREGQIRQIFSGAFEVPLGDWTPISEFGPPVVSGYDLSQSWPFVRALYMTENAAGDFSQAALPAEGLRARARDWGGNVSLTTQPFAAGTVPPSTGFPPDLQRLRVVAPPGGTAVCGGLSGACSAGTPKALTIDVDATVDLGAEVPFPRMILMRRDPQGVDQFLAIMTLDNVRTEAGQSVWRWTHVFDPTAEGGLPPQATSAVWVIGVNAEGDGFLTNVAGSFTTVDIQ